MAPIQLTDDEQPTSCLGSIFSRFTKSSSAPTSSSSNEKFVYVPVDAMDHLPAYEECITKVTLYLISLFIFYKTLTLSGNIEFQ